MGLSFVAVAVEVALVGGALAVLAADLVWSPPRRILGWLAGLSLAGATVAAGFQWNRAVSDGLPGLAYRDMLALDGFAVFGAFAIVVVTAVALAGAWELVEEQADRAAELIVLVLLAAAGVHLMAASANLVVLFLGLEVASISLYVMAGYTRARPETDEAAVKYFLLGAFASAVFLYGVALVYAATGSTDMYAIAGFLSSTVVLDPGILVVGIALIVAGIAFKVTAAPFHMWAPDVYQGAPTALSGYMAAAAKIGGFAALARLVAVPLLSRLDDLGPALAGVAAISVAVGTVLALAQSDLKRMLAYSGIAHAGFILTGLTAGGDGVQAVWFYVVTYAFQLVGAFVVASIVSGSASSRSALTDFAGLARRSPPLAAAMTLFMIAMGGIPLTAGFVGKAAVFQVAIEAGYLWLVILGLVAAVAGLFFYLRVVVLMYMQEPVLAEGPGAALAEPVTAAPAQAALVATGVATVVLGIVPWPLLNLLEDALPL